MLTGLVFFFSSLSVFLILTEVLTVNIIHIGNITVFELNFTIFAFAFKYDTSKKSIKSRKRKRKNKNSTVSAPFSSYTAAKSFISVFLKRSEIEIFEFNAIFPINDPDKNYIRYGIYNSLLSSLFAFLEKNTKNFASSNIIIAYSEHNKPRISFDVKVKISLLNIILSILILALTFLKSTFAKERKLWRKTK